MIELRLKYLGGGKFQSAGKLDFDLASSQLEDGEVVRAKVMRPRSTKQNAFFHALIQRAYEHQTGGPKFSNWKVLKDWLLIHADHSVETRKNVGRLTGREVGIVGTTLAMVLRTEHDFVGIAYDRRRQEMILRTAKSTAKLDSEKMSELTTAVEALILQEICPGLTVDEIMGDTRRAA